MFDCKKVIPEKLCAKLQKTHLFFVTDVRNAQTNHLPECRLNRLLCFTLVLPLFVLVRQIDGLTRTCHEPVR